MESAIDESELDKNDDIKVLSNNEDTEEHKNEMIILRRLEKELEETKDKILRVLAESENTRKQMEKNRIDMAKYGGFNHLQEN